MKTGWIWLLVATLVLSPEPAAAKKKRKRKAKPAPPPSVRLAPIADSPFYTIDVKIGKYGTGKMIVNTGATETVISDWFIREKEVPLVQTKDYGTDASGRRFLVSRAKITNLAIGKQTVEVPFVQVVPSPRPFVAFRIAGVISPQTLFKDKSLLLDFPSKKLHIGAVPAPALDRHELLETIALAPCSPEQPERLVVNGSIEGMDGRFFLDTGGARSSIAPNFSRRFGGRILVPPAPPPAAGTQTGPSAPTENMVLSLGDLSRRVPIEIDNRAAACPTADGKIGNDVLKSYALLFDADRKTLKVYKSP